MKRPSAVLALAATMTMLATACGGDTGADDRHRPAPDNGTSADGRPGDTLTVYSRDRDIAEPLFELFEQQTGIQIRARWGNPVELAEQIIADGTSSPADVFYGPFSDALGSLSAAGRLAALSDKQLRRVPEVYRSPDGTWVGTTGRAHAVFYNTDQLTEEDLPDSILGFTDPAWRNSIGWDPTSRSLQDVITALRQLQGEDKAREWLEGIQANAPAEFRGAVPIINAVAGGKIVKVGFGSHSYLNELKSEGDAANVAAKFYRGGDPGGLLNVAGVGIVKGTDNEAAANALVDFMLSKTAQQYFANDSYEIPLVEGIEPPKEVPTANELTVPDLDVRQFEELQGARRLLTDVGITM